MDLMYEWRGWYVGYKIIKIRDPTSQRLGLLFTVSYPEIKTGERPRRRFMSAFEQKREIPNRALQYMVVRLSSSSVWLSISPSLPFLHAHHLPWPSLSTTMREKNKAYIIFDTGQSWRTAGGRTIRNDIIRNPIKRYGRWRRRSRSYLGTLGCGWESLQLSIIVQVGSLVDVCV